MAKQTAENSESKKEKLQYANLQQIADLLGVTEFDIKTFVRIGFPKAGHNKFIPIQCFKWYINHLLWQNEHWTVTDIATVCGVSVRTIQLWVVKNNIPKKERGYYNVRSTILAWINSINEKHENTTGEKTLNRSRQRLVDMQAEIKQMELLQLQRTLFPVADAKKMVTEITTMVSKKLDSIPGLELNKKFGCKTKEELLKVEEEIIHKIKTELSKAELNITKKHK